MIFNRNRADALTVRDRIDALVATSIDNVAYLTGHSNPTHDLMRGAQVFALYAPGAAEPAAAIIPRLEIETYLESGAWVDDVHLVGLFSRAPGDPSRSDARGLASVELEERARPAASAIAGLVDALTRRGVANGRIALDEGGLTPQAWAAIAAALPDAEIVPGSNLLWDIRTVKTPEEIRRLRESARITEAAVEAMLREVRPGLSEIELGRLYDASVARLGGRPSFNMVAVGAGTGQPHLINSDRRLGEGELIRWDNGCTYRSYHSDTARAVSTGEPTARQARTWEALATGVEEAIGLVRPGADPGAIFRAAMRPGLEAGLPAHQRFHCGHGIGISVYDPPVITEMDPTKSVFLMPGLEGGLLPGMVINIEAGHYTRGEEGFLCEDTLLVTETGAERLTHAPKALRLADWQL